MYYFTLSVQQRLFLPGLQIPVAESRFTNYFLNKKNPLTLLILLNIERYFNTRTFCNTYFPLSSCKNAALAY